MGRINPPSGAVYSGHSGHRHSERFLGTTFGTETRTKIASRFAPVIDAQGNLRHGVACEPELGSICPTYGAAVRSKSFVT